MDSVIVERMLTPALVHADVADWFTGRRERFSDVESMAVPAPRGEPDRVAAAS